MSDRRPESEDKWFNSLLAALAVAVSFEFDVNYSKYLFGVISVIAIGILFFTKFQHKPVIAIYIILLIGVVSLDDFLLKRKQAEDKKIVTIKGILLDCRPYSEEDTNLEGVDVSCKYGDYEIKVYTDKYSNFSFFLQRSEENKLMNLTFESQKFGSIIRQYNIDEVHNQNIKGIKVCLNQK